MQPGIIGYGSWATALAKILTDNGQTINWWIRTQETIDYFEKRHHNPRYLSSVHFDMKALRLSNQLSRVLETSDTLIVAVPSAYVEETLAGNRLAGKKIISAVKGILPGQNLLLNQLLEKDFGLPATDYFTIMGPCHAEEVAAEKLSYLTLSGRDEAATRSLAANFSTSYVNTVVNTDVDGVQYAAVLKNIYALGAGIAHGLEYGDNFLSVFIANCAAEMSGFLSKAAIPAAENDPTHAASVYLGDLLVTCYSLYSRNRTFGNMIGKGYSVKTAQLEINMVAEGYNASRCIHLINQQIGAQMPIATAVYRILWEGGDVAENFEQIEAVLV